MAPPAAALAPAAAVAPITAVAEITQAAAVAEITQAAAVAEIAPVEPPPPVLEATPPPRPEVAAAQAAAPPVDPPPVSPSQAPNPYSAGTFPLGRNYKLGDEILYRQTDILTGVEEQLIDLRVTRVDWDADRVEFNHGKWISDTSGNLLKMGRQEYEFPVQIFPAELQVGKKWTTRFKIIANATVFDLDLRIPEREVVRVPAGEFNAFKIEGRGFGSAGQSMHVIYWVVPGLNAHYVKRELTVRNQQGRFRITARHELLAYRQ